MDRTLTAAGLCATCAQVRLITSARGSTFVLCLRSETDPAFSKYPRLPVVRCSGYDPARSDAAAPRE